MRHESIAHYEADTIVDDVEDPPARSTSPTEAFDVMVMLDDGAWHREMDYRTTACEKPIPHVGNWKRIQTYDGNLCAVCYSPAELARAAEANAAELERLTGEHPKLFTNGELKQDITDWLTGAPPRRKPKKDKP
jgi:hypothetical protein